MARKTSLTEYPWSPLIDHPDDLERGGMCRWVPYSDHRTMKPNTPQRLRLALQDYGRGQSAAYFIFDDEHGRIWFMFLTDLVDTIRDPRWSAGIIEATWVICKRGQNYGIRLADDPMS